MKPKTKVIQLQITNKGIHFNDREWIPWNATNFPDKSTFNINDRDPIFWEVALLSFDKDRSDLHVRVIRYNVQATAEAFSRQQAKYPIKSITFDALSWSEIQKICSFYIKTAFQKIADTENTPDDKPKRTEPTKYIRIPGKADIPIIKTIDINFEYPLIKATFKMGHVEIEKKIKSWTVGIRLYNDNIIPEFDHVKPYFAKALEKRKISVVGTLGIDAEGGLHPKFRSADIDRIDHQLISIVRKLNLKDLILKNLDLDTDKSLFTPEEYFDSVAEKNLGKAISMEGESNIIDELIGIEEIRNRKHLHYLAGKLQSQNAGLRFTLTPKFGFLFFTEGERMDHFIWELLNDHATYIWSIPDKGLSTAGKFQAIELQIDRIREMGRRNYLQFPIEEEILFQRVIHEDSSSDFIDGFPKWKTRIEEKLV